MFTASRGGARLPEVIADVTARVENIYSGTCVPKYRILRECSQLTLVVKIMLIFYVIVILKNVLFGKE